MPDQFAKLGKFLPLVAVAAMYAFTAVATTVLGIDVFTPCASNFEGGCSMGKSLLASFSLFLALFAFGLAFGIQSVMASIPATAPHSAKAGWLLAGVPAIYILATLKALFIG